MEATRKPSTPSTQKEEDVDLGRLFQQTGSAIGDFFNAIGRMFKAIGYFILQVLFFLRRNIVWLLLGAGVGIAYGFYLHSKNGSNYRSEMTIRTNYNSAPSLYGTIDYFNALVSSGETAQLAKIFNISEQDAASLKMFEARPVKSELIAAQLYKERFLNLYHNTRIRMDTFWIKTVKYDDFKSSLTKHDYPDHQVVVTSKSPFIFPRIQEGLIAQVSNNKLLQLEKSNGLETNQDEINLLQSSIRSLDTLRNSYNKRLSSSSSGKEASTSVTMVEGNVALSNPELQLYDKMLQLKDELKMVKTQAVAENDIIQVYAPFGAMGKKGGLLDHEVVRYGVFGLLLAIIITGAIAVYHYLTTLEKRMLKEKV